MEAPSETETTKALLAKKRAELAQLEEARAALVALAETDQTKIPHEEIKQPTPPPPTNIGPLTEAKAQVVVAPKSKEEKITAGEILDGKDAENLVQSMKSFEMKSGESVVAGTDKGIGYKPHNEDRIVVSTEENLVAVIDGMGGMGHGELAAELLAKSISENPENIDDAVLNSIDRMKEKNVGEGGAVFISAKLRTEAGGKFLDISQLGDCKLIIIKKDGKISFESKDQSLTQTLVDAKIITADEALYHGGRATVDTAVSPDIKEEQRKIKKYDSVQVEEGDLVILMSDGLSDNFTPEEIAKAKTEYKLGADGLFLWLSNAADRRMREIDEIRGKTTEERTAILEKRKTDGVYSDGYKSEPKKDNRGLAIVEIKENTVYAKQVETIRKQFVVESSVSYEGENGEIRNCKIKEVPTEAGEGEFVLETSSSDEDKSKYFMFDLDDFIKKVVAGKIKFISGPEKNEGTVKTKEQLMAELQATIERTQQRLLEIEAELGKLE